MPGRGREPRIAVGFPSSRLYPLHPSSLGLLARFAVTRGQPLDPAEEHSPSDSLVFKLMQAYGKMSRDARLSSG